MQSMYKKNFSPFLPFLAPAFGLPFFAALAGGDRSFFAPFPPFFVAASAIQIDQSNQ
jgi:hypothetical protein